MTGSSILQAGEFHTDRFERSDTPGRRLAWFVEWVALLPLLFMFILVHPAAGICAQPAVAAGYGHTVALKEDGTVWAWGRNNKGQLGDGSTMERHTPVQVVGSRGMGFLTGVTAIAAHYLNTVALKDDGTVWTWGNNDYGQLGDNTRTSSYTPVQVVGPGGTGFLTDVTAIAAGYGHMVALKDDGTVWAWGDNGYGVLGDGTTDPSYTPVQVLGPEGVGVLTGMTAIAAGSIHTVTLKDDGTVWAWGYNYKGQLGDGTTDPSYTPVQVLGPEGVGVLTGMTAIAAGWYHTVALKEDRTVWAWGNNGYGQLGDGTIAERHTPVQVLGPIGNTGLFAEVTGISARWLQTMALKDNGEPPRDCRRLHSVRGWGHETAKQIFAGGT